MITKKELIEAHNDYAKTIYDTENTLKKIFSNQDDFNLDEIYIKEWKRNKKLQAVAEDKFKSLLKKYRHQKKSK